MHTEKPKHTHTAVGPRCGGHKTLTGARSAALYPGAKGHMLYRCHTWAPRRHLHNTEPAQKPFTGAELCLNSNGDTGIYCNETQGYMTQPQASQKR